MTSYFRIYFALHQKDTGLLQKVLPTPFKVGEKAPVLAVLEDMLQKGYSSAFLQLLDYLTSRYPDYVNEIIQSTLLHYSVLAHDMEATNRLLELGADPSNTNGVNLTPLHIAASRGYDDFITALLAKDTERKSLNAQDALARTPLHLACQGRHESTIHLLEHTYLAKDNIPDMSGFTASHYYERRETSFQRGTLPALNITCITYKITTRRTRETPFHTLHIGPDKRCTLEQDHNVTAIVEGSYSFIVVPNYKDITGKEVPYLIRIYKAGQSVHSNLLDTKEMIFGGELTIRNQRISSWNNQCGTLWPQLNDPGYQTVKELFGIPCELERERTKEIALLNRLGHRLPAQVQTPQLPASGEERATARITRRSISFTSHIEEERGVFQGSPLFIQPRRCYSAEVSQDRHFLNAP